MLESKLHEFRVAATAVLENDVVAAGTDHDRHTLLRRQAQHLNAWFGSRAGWRLDEHPEFVRLLKLPARPDPSLFAPWAHGARDYELFAWVLWYSERHGARKFRLSDLAAQIRDRSSTHGGPAFDWLRHDDRLRLRRVMEALERMGAVRIRGRQRPRVGAGRGQEGRALRMGGAYVADPGAVHLRHAGGARRRDSRRGAGARGRGGTAADAALSCAAAHARLLPARRSRGVLHPEGAG